VYLHKEQQLSLCLRSDVCWAQLTIDIGINMYVYQISGVNVTDDQIRYDPNANVEQSVNWADNDACQVFD